MGKNKGYPATNIRSTYPYQHNYVFSTDPLNPDSPTMWVYTVEEFDALVADKANKTGPTDHGNIALLDSSGDLVDSGIHPNDLYICSIDGGTF